MGHGFGWIFMILFWGILIYLVVQGVNRWSLNGSGRSQLKTAEDILKERYAKGEISKDEYTRMKQDLRS